VIGVEWTEPTIVAAAVTAAVTLVVFVAGALVNQRAALNKARRERYANAYRDLVAWTELPYRIRRRTSDSPEVLADLAAQFHDLQERIACDSAWIRSDHTPVGRWFAGTTAALKRRCAPAIAEAWKQPPVAGPDGMVLGDIGLDVTELLEFAATVVAYPFTARRFDPFRKLTLEDAAAKIRSTDT
jgi:hypothetical protein